MQDGIRLRRGSLEVLSGLVQAGDDHQATPTHQDRDQGQEGGGGQAGEQHRGAGEEPRRSLPKSQGGKEVSFCIVA